MRIFADRLIRETATAGSKAGGYGLGGTIEKADVLSARPTRRTGRTAEYPGGSDREDKAPVYAPISARYRLPEFIAAIDR